MPDRSKTHHLARWALSAFLITFLAARALVFLVMSGHLPDLFLYIGQTHVHHLNFGIFLLSIVAGYLLFSRSAVRRLRSVSVAYGIGLGLTFDEFGMWLHLGGGYWQRASYDAVVVIAGLLSLISVAPLIRQFRPHHWTTVCLLVLLLAVFTVLLTRSFGYAERAIVPELERLDEPG